MAKLTPREAVALVGTTVTVHARRSNGTYKSAPEPITGRVVACGQVFGTYRSQPHALVIHRGPHVTIVTLARITKVTSADGESTWFDASAAG